MKTEWSWLLLSAMLLSAGCDPRPPVGGSSRGAAPAALPSFTVFDPAPGFQPPPIVLQYDPATKTGANWAEIGNPQWHVSTPPVMCKKRR